MRTLVVNPCKCDLGGLRTANAYAKITYDRNCLSISGAVGPLSSGNCRGSAGQCVDEIRSGEPADGWTREMLDKFCGIWKQWHLNDMRPYCEHQKALGWDKIASKKVTLYHYTLNREAMGKKRQAEQNALAALREGRTFTPTDEQIKYASIDYELTTHKALEGEMAQDYGPRKALYPGGSDFTEEKLLGWIGPDEHPEGILGKPCPVCGYKYGTAWRTEDVPSDVLDWLFSLPETRSVPAWV